MAVPFVDAWRTAAARYAKGVRQVKMDVGLENDVQQRTAMIFAEHSG